MSATIYNFDDTKKSEYKFPEFIFIDTSFLLNSFVPVPEKDPSFPNRINILCSNFLTDLRNKAKQEEICLFTDDYVLQEFFYFILKSKIECIDSLTPPFDNHFQHYISNKKNPISEIFKDHPELINKYYSLLEDYYARILAIPIAILTPDLLVTKNDKQISEKALVLIKQYEILPADAFHIAVAQQAGINYFVVVDADYHKVSGINIFTCISDRKKCFICSSTRAS